MTASGSNVFLGIGLEGTRGVTQTTLFNLPTISRNINLKKDILESAAVTSTRQRSDVRHGFNRVEGELTVELRTAFYDSLLLGALGSSAWSAATTANAQMALAVGSGGASGSPGSSALITRSSGDFIVDGYRPGDWVRTSGFATAANNGLYRSTNVTATTMTLASDSGAPFVDELVPGARTITYEGTRATIGNALPTFTIERSILKVDAGDTLNVYNTFSGCAVNTFSLSARPESLVTATFNILGMTADIDRTSSVDSNGYGDLPKNTNGLESPPFASLDATLYFGGSIAQVTGFDFTMDNQRSLLGILGRRTSLDVYEGTCKVTGTISSLIQGNFMPGAFESESTSVAPFMITFRELGSSSFLSFSFYKCKFTSHDMDPPQNGPVIQVAQFEALEQTFGTTKMVMHIQRGYSVA